MRTVDESDWFLKMLVSFCLVFLMVVLVYLGIAADLKLDGGRGCSNKGSGAIYESLLSL